MEEHDGPQVAPTAAQQRATQAAIPKFVSLPSKYNLTQHPIYLQGSSGIGTKEAEFEKYKNGPLSSPETDLVDFWNVSHWCCSFRNIVILEFCVI